MMDEVADTSSSNNYSLEYIENVIRSCKHFLDLSTSESYELDDKIINYFYSNDEDDKLKDYTSGFHFNSSPESCSIVRQIDRSFKCEICEKTFTRKHHLYSHFMIHTGERPHKCKVCERSFRQKSDVKRHELIHTKEKSFSCPKCGMSFRLKTYLNKHAKIHL